MAAKKSYKKPEIKKIGLAPEECCVAGCKTTKGTARGGFICRQGAGNCNNNPTNGS